jgi:hypothetical protein
MDDEGQYYQVGVEVRRSRSLTCGDPKKGGAGCGKKGASIGCQVPKCPLSYHYPCALNTGWAFRNSRRFFCHKHREPNSNFDTKVHCICGEVDDSAEGEVSTTTANGW